MRKLNRRIQKPDLPEQLDPINVDELKGHSFFEMGTVKKAIGPVHAEGVNFEQLYFNDVTFTETELPTSQWIDVIFDNCDLSGIQLNSARFSRVEFRNCKLAGTDFDRAIMHDVTLTDCQAPYVLCNLTELRDVQFDNCLLKGANFIDGWQNNLQLGTSDIEDVQFTGTSLENVDLSRCLFNHIHIDEQNLRGAVIAPEQAAGFIEVFGVKVKG
ncbi:Pentapeptide repeat-containing protein [Lentibacillus persicus]|uniref:Pentapeptide repeat-containing protein n=1 Tax=Lentibacillus persicus TaxID=640948 RepID=A0A1I1UAS8_9BACI|nr:pentapeptide repeat-containing protein [Lentibacillus persicus]SFD67971.1 Pentapeptide repeat-containing protein [Lentibacillus persicus]